MNWVYYVTRNFAWFVTHAYMTAGADEALRERLFGVRHASKYQRWIRGEEYYLEEEAKEYEKKLDNLFKKDPNFFKKMAKRQYELSKNLSTISEIITQNRNLENKTNRQLAMLLEKFTEAYLSQCAIAAARPDSYLEKESLKNLKRYLHNIRHKPREFQDYFSKLTLPPRDLFSTSEHLNLLKIGSNLQKDKEALNLFLKNILPLTYKEKIKNHLEEFGWLKSPITPLEEIASVEEIIGRLKYLLRFNCSKKLKEIESRRQEDEQEHKDALSFLKIEGRLLHLILATREFIYLRLYTSEMADRAAYRVRHTLFKEIAKRMSLLELNDSVYLNLFEMLEFLKTEKRPSNKEINDRKIASAYIMEDGKVTYYFGKAALEFATRMEEKFERQDEIWGYTANSGFAIGSAKIVKSVSDCQKVKKGDILVSSMTIPEYIMAMEKSAAFVTDEGGITCHAAIVAREFDVPCVVGTRKATKILKDGDTLVVDANKGRVRKL